MKEVLVEHPQVSNAVEIAGELASTLGQLPPVWRFIAESGEGYGGMTDREAYVQMAQLFYYKMNVGDVDLFNQRSDLMQYLDPFRRLFGQLAFEALEFYGQDFHASRYPDFGRTEDNLDRADPDLDDKRRVVAIARQLFGEFGYDLPASFYHVHLAPIAREQVCEIVPLRFSEQDKLNARAWDAALHGQKVFPIQLVIQSISSQYGFFWEHGCGCNHGLSRVGRTDSPFSYKLRPEMRRTWIRDFLWTVWYEYAFFPFVPVTRFLTGQVVEFT